MDIVWSSSSLNQTPKNALLHRGTTTHYVLLSASPPFGGLNRQPWNGIHSWNCVFNVERVFNFLVYSSQYAFPAAYAIFSGMPIGFPSCTQTKRCVILVYCVLLLAQGVGEQREYLEGVLDIDVSLLHLWFLNCMAFWAYFIDLLRKPFFETGAHFDEACACFCRSGIERASRVCVFEFTRASSSAIAHAGQTAAAAKRA